MPLRIPVGPPRGLLATKTATEPTAEAGWPEAGATMDHQRGRSRPVTLEPRPPGMNCKPWYKDRLPSKYLAKSKNGPTFPSSLSSRSWVFVREGLDDFREGCPPCGDMIIRGPKEGFLPVIYRTTPRPAPKSCRKKLSKNAALFSKLSPAQLARKAFVEKIEAGLKKTHLLAYYPDLEDEMPVELLKKVLEVLDPDKQLEDAWAYCLYGRKRKKEPTELTKNCDRKVCLSLPKPTPMPNPEDLLKELQASIENLPKAAIQRNLSKAVTSFCKWVASLGCTGIDEEFILKQFELDCNCKPKLPPPQMKEVIQVPPEVKYIQGPSKPAQSKISLREPDLEKKLQERQIPHQKKHVKMRYGAWYLPPKLWKKLREDEPLLDPKAPPEIEDCYFKRDEKEPDILEGLYGPIAFKDFILSKGYSMPHLIEKLFTRKGWKYDTTKIPTILTRNYTNRDSSEEV